MTDLTGRQREILATVERVVSQKKAAELLGITEPGVRAQMSYIKAKLRRGANIGEDAETPETARERIAREVADGKRCKRCWLLEPCCGHGGF